MRLSGATVVAMILGAAGCGGADSSGDDRGDPIDATIDAPGDAEPAQAVKTVFIILMENHDWADLKGNSDAPYINSLLATGAHAEAYNTPPGLHPSEPNYLWLEAGSNLGVTDDKDPGTNHQATTAHLVTQLEAAGISWKAYVEDISGTACPLTSSGTYGAKHVPMLFFDDVTDSNQPSSAHCIAHVRPYGELATDLAAGTAARYNFITPNMCHDMHGVIGLCTPILTNLIKPADDWLATEVPQIMASAAYADHGAIFITWDEGSENFLAGTASDGPIGMIVLSAAAKAGHASTIAYTHSSTVKTMQEIFGIGAALGDSATATDLADLFTRFP